LNIFEKIGFKIISSRLNTTKAEENLVFSVGQSEKNGKTISISLSSELIDSLGWCDVERVSILSDSKNKLGITTPYGDETTYKLIKLSPNSTKRQIKFTWKPEIINEPLGSLRVGIEYKVLTDAGKTGVSITLPESIFNKGD
jgi:hypothetical protein